VAAIIFNSGRRDGMQHMVRDAVNDSIPDPKIPGVFVTAQSGKTMQEHITGEGGQLHATLQQGKVVIWSPKSRGLRVEPVRRAPGRTVVLSGSSKSIVDRWAATMAGLQPGDRVQLAPGGGQLEVGGAPLAVPLAVAVSGAPFAAGDDGGVKAGGKLGARPGSVVVKCGPKAETAIVIRWAGWCDCCFLHSLYLGSSPPPDLPRSSAYLTLPPPLPPTPPKKQNSAPGASLQDLTFTGCQTQAIVLQTLRGKGGAAIYPRNDPVHLRRLTVVNAQAGVRALEGAALAVAGCSFRAVGRPKVTGNAALLAEAGTWLNVTDTEFVGAAMGGVAFKGEAFAATRVRFAGCERPALILWYEPPSGPLARPSPSPAQDIAITSVTSCVFEDNIAVFTGDGYGDINGGGAIFVGKQTAVSVVGSTFVNNTADLGGAIYIDEGAWMGTLVGSNFARNHARAFGGGVFIWARGCEDLRGKGATDIDDTCYMVVKRVKMLNNTAGADGGAFFLENSPDASVNFTACEFAGNAALGDAPWNVTKMWSWVVTKDRLSCTMEHAVQPAGFGGALYLGFLSWGNAFFFGCSLTDNRAARGGGAVHACGMTASPETFNTVGFANTTLARNWAGTDEREFPPDTAGGAVQVVGNHMEVALDGSAVVDNTAARGGGISWAVDHGAFGLAHIDYVRRLENETRQEEEGAVGWPFSGLPDLYPKRAEMTSERATVFERNVATAGDGGALSFVGTSTVIMILNALVAGNSAAQGGGGVSVFADNSLLLLVRANVTGNSAGAVGGGGVLAVGKKGLNVTVVKSRLAGNAVAGPDAAGGGLCSHRCTMIELAEMTATGNSAGGFGGGVAVVRTLADALVASCVIKNNTAGTAPRPAPPVDGDILPPFKGGEAAAAAAVRPTRGLRLQQAERFAERLAQHALEGHLHSLRRRLAQEEPLLATVPDLSSQEETGSLNITGDDALYRGGGGLYASASGNIMMRGTVISDNQGANGGAFGGAGWLLCSCWAVGAAAAGGSLLAAADLS
jgi:hypothetical protein